MESSSKAGKPGNVRLADDTSPNSKPQLDEPLGRKEKWDAFLTLVQTIIALFMLWTLVQSREQMRLAQQSLDLSRKQFESTIEPVISVTSDGEQVHIENLGTIPVSRIEITGILQAAYVRGCMKASSMDVNPRPISEEVLLGGAQTHFPIQPLIDSLSHVRPSGDEKIDADAYGMVFCYRRAVDMKPFYQLFVILHDSQLTPVGYLDPLHVNLTSGEGSQTMILPSSPSFPSAFFVASPGGANWVAGIRKDIETKLEEMGHKYR